MGGRDEDWIQAVLSPGVQLPGQLQTPRPSPCTLCSLRGSVPCRHWVESPRGCAKAKRMVPPLGGGVSPIGVLAVMVEQSPLGTAVP